MTPNSRSNRTAEWIIQGTMQNLLRWTLTALRTVSINLHTCLLSEHHTEEICIIWMCHFFYMDKYGKQWKGCFVTLLCSNFLTPARNIQLLILNLTSHFPFQIPSEISLVFFFLSFCCIYWDNNNWRCVVYLWNTDMHTKSMSVAGV